MSNVDLGAVIADSPLGKELTASQCADLANIVSLRSLDDDDYLLEEGLTESSLYVVIRGKIEVVKNTGGDEAITLHVLKTGDMAGAMGFIDGTPHSASLRALGNTEVLALDRADLEGLLASDAMLVYRVMRAIVRTVHDILRRMNLQHVEMSNYISKAHGRY